ncbi:MAG: M20/M25/M40 family metallo-hydrolase, partial [Lawsonibacter sp.]
MIVLWVILSLIALLLATVLIRTAAFRPKNTPTASVPPVDFDRERAVQNLQALVRCKTISFADHSLEDEGEFEKLISLLPDLYPNVFKACSLTRLPDRGLLFKWAGKNSGAPSVMMAHYDVVPVEEETWDKPPFAGIIENGILWGRGTLDTKVAFNGALTGADHLIAQGFVPENDIYFAFSGQEEINGLGAVHIVDWFVEHKITPALVVDEGG